MITEPQTMQCVQCTTPLRAGSAGHGQYRCVGRDASTVHACSAACARATMAAPDSIHSVQVGQQHPLHAVLTRNPQLVDMVGEALADGTFRVTRPSVAAPLVAWMQQIGPKRSAYSDDRMDDDDIEDERDVRVAARGTVTLPRSDFAWRAAEPVPTSAPSHKRSVDDDDDDDEVDWRRLAPVPVPVPVPAPPPPPPVSTASLPALRRPPTRTRVLLPPAAAPAAASKRATDEMDADLDLEPPRHRGLVLRRIPSGVMLEMVEALVLAGAAPMTTFEGMSRLAHRAGENIDQLRAFLGRLPAGLVSEAASSLLRRRVRTPEERLDISVAVSLLLRNRASASMVKNSRTLTTPLHWAARGGYATVAEVAIATGADINGADAYGFTPLDYAYAGGQPAHTGDPSETMVSWLEERLAMRSGRAFSP